MVNAKNISVLFSTAEVFPLVKTGGLADVSYALPKALRQMGVDVRLLLPGYLTLLEHLALIEVCEPISLFPNVAPARVLAGFIDGDLPIYVLDCPSLYQREGGPYQDQAGNEWWDNVLRFGALSKVAARFGNHHYLFRPQIVHCNDWQTGLAPAFMAHDSSSTRAKTVMSIHNMAYQGVFGPESAELFHWPSTTDMYRVVEFLGLPSSSFDMEGVEYYGKMSFLKAGLYYADWLTTVSPSYAQDIQTIAFGYGLQGLLSQRRAQLTGILNGIDTQAWDPATDPYITHHYSTDNLAAKAKNTQALRRKLGLEQGEWKPLIGMVTRLTYQKGLDLLVPIIPELIEQGAQLVLLGSGDKALEQQLIQLAKQSPRQISINLRYDEALAHQIEASADIFLMPSLFEPCGLNQMYSMHYGTIPIVRRTGGLADTVIDASPTNIENKLATGFVFEEEDPQVLYLCIQRALQTFRDKATWRTLQLNGMMRDFSWHHSALEYLSLYQNLLTQ